MTVAIVVYKGSKLVVYRMLTYIRHHYPAKISFRLSYEQGRYQTTLDDGTLLLFDGKGELIK